MTLSSMQVDTTREEKRIIYLSRMTDEDIEYAIQQYWQKYIDAKKITQFLWKLYDIRVDMDGNPERILPRKVSLVLSKLHDAGRISFYGRSKNGKITYLKRNYQ
ncbi:MAG: hypothetical protein QW393_04835 [Candidatus Micrarchaeaceae archaeon]